MTLIFQFIFWICVAGLLHTYLLYPLLMRAWAKNKPLNPLMKEASANWPRVSVVMAVYNEEKVIRQKMESLLALDYPQELIDIYVGSDCSTDATNAILQEFAEQDQRVHIFPFKQRRGKPGQVNELVAHIQADFPPNPHHLYLMTDASVMLPPPTLQCLARHFHNPAIALVDANMLSSTSQSKGIARSEQQYVSREVRIKQDQSRYNGQMIGPFGGCYCLRSDYFTEVPPNFLVDDFFICMKALAAGGLAINDLEAVCYEEVSGDIWEEYRRKRRISGGNFQNLATFRRIWTQPWDSLGFAFFSHKVLRWMGPFFIIFAFVSSLIVGLNGNKLFFYLLCLQILVFFGIPLLDWILKKLQVNSFFLRSISYFLLMNAALLEGFFNYTKGIKSNVWQPTKRH